MSALVIKRLIGNSFLRIKKPLEESSGRTLVALVSLIVLCSCSRPGNGSFGLAQSPKTFDRDPPKEIGSKNPDQMESKTDGLKPGDIAPDFILMDRRGKAFQLSSFRGNFVLLNFWATWCPPCVEELPAMDALNSLLRTKQFSMIAVSVDDSWQEISGFLGKLSRLPNFLILNDPTQSVVSQLYGTTKFPESYLISPEGKVLKKYVGAISWMSDGVLDELYSHIEAIRLPDIPGKPRK